MSATLVGVLAKLLAVGIKTWDAVVHQGFGKEEIEALKGAIEAGESAAGLRKTPAAGAGAQHLALIVASFGRAFEQHWVGTRRFATHGLRRFFDKEEQARQHEIETRLRLAHLGLPGLGDRGPGLEELALVDGWVHGPLHTPWYRELWRVFSDPKLTIAELGEKPPLDLQPTTARQFERHFLLAYWQGLGGAPGRVLEPHLQSMEKYRQHLVRETLVADIAGWGTRHVFGNLQRHKWPANEPLPFLPLGKMYIEPLARFAHRQKEPNEPILRLLQRLLGDRKTRIIIVKADFGMGKSLTARTLAARLAAAYLEDARVSMDLSVPVFVRCAEDFSDEGFDLKGTVQRAGKRQAEDIDLSLPADDPAFDLPETQQRAVFFLDGLDEIALGHRRLETLFQRLRDAATERRQFILFSRPGVLPEEKQLKDIPVVEVLPFATGATEDPSGGQIDRWLTAWNHLVREEGPPITLAQLGGRQLMDLASTPILLFMIAHSWELHPDAAPLSRAALYESFFQQVACGKADADKEHHPAIHRASHHLLEQLRTLGELDKSDLDVREPQAMLWLLSRVAWEAHKLTQRQPPEPLTRLDVANLLKNELHIRGDDAPDIEIGLLLALQADLSAGADHILFGHQSFREFLVARYWADRLKKIAQARERDWPEHTEKLLGGRLLGDEDRSYQFLMQMLNGEPSRWSPSSPLRWNEQLRRQVFEWAEECFNDDRLRCPHSPRLEEDQGAMLREAALAIGSEIHGSPGVKAHDPSTLRSLLAWFWMVGQDAIIIAPWAHLDRAILAGASLAGASLVGASLAYANLVDVILVGANLADARLDDADLVGANLHGAHLYGASLANANLDGAHLHGAGLVHARLTGAKLTGASLGRATYDDTTRWPDGFDPAQAGAIHIHDLEQE